MAAIAVMRGKPKDYYHRHRSNKHYANHVVTFKYNTTTEHKPPEAMVGVMVNLKTVTTVATSTTNKQ